MARKLALDGVHVLAKVPGTSMFTLKSINTAMRLGNGDESVYLQSGQVFDEGGQPMPDKDLPGWFDEAIARCNPKVLAEIGYRPRPGAAKAKGLKFVPGKTEKPVTE